MSADTTITIKRPDSVSIDSGIELTYGQHRINNSPLHLLLKSREENAADKTRCNFDVKSSGN